MANGLYDPGREGFLDGSLNWSTGTIKALLMRGYTFASSHKFVSDMTAAGGNTTITASGALASKGVTSGVASAADITFNSVAAGANITAIVLYQSSAASGGADLTNITAMRLIGFIDTATGLTGGLTPNGGNITVSWDTGANKIFKL